MTKVGDAMLGEMNILSFIHNSPHNLSGFYMRIFEFGPLILILLFSYCSIQASAEDINQALDNFEWKTPKQIQETNYDQYPKGIDTDDITGQSYCIFENREPVTEDPAPGNGLTRCRFNSTINDFDSITYHPYPGDYSDYLVYNDTWYTFFVTTDYLHFRIGDDKTDTLSWNLQNVGRAMYRVLGVIDNQIIFIWLCSGPYRVVLFTIDIETFNTTRGDIIQHNFNPQEVHHVVVDDVLYLALAQYEAGSDDTIIWLYKYNFSSKYTSAPLPIWFSSTENFGNWDIDIDSEGNIHLLLEQLLWKLVKISPSGKVLQSVRLFVQPGDTREVRGSLFLILNETDCIFVAGWLYYNTSSSAFMISWTLKIDYQIEGVRKFITYNRFTFYQKVEESMGTLTNGQSLIIFQIFSDDSRKVMYTCTIPPAPDLAVSSD